jgi:biotin operon repressor
MSSLPQRIVGEPFNPWWKICGFYPPDVVNANTRLKLTDGQKRLYERAVRWAGRNGEFWYSFPEIAEKLGKSERQIYRDMATLEEKGLMAHVRRRRQSNLYRFLWHPIFEVQPTAHQEILNLTSTADQELLNLTSTSKKAVLNLTSTSGELCPKENYVQEEPPLPPSLCASDDARMVESALTKIPRSADGYRPEWFEEWWAIYWRKVARKPAQKAFQKHVKTRQRFEEVMAATRAQTPTMMARDPEKRPHGATWLNGERWNDEPSTPAKKPPERQSLIERTKARWAERLAKGERPI